MARCAERWLVAERVYEVSRNRGFRVRLIDFAVISMLLLTGAAQA